MTSTSLHFERLIKRKFYYWLEHFSDKVLYIEGPRQVGKTFLIQEFANEVFKKEHIFYLNLDENKNLDLMIQVSQEISPKRDNPFQTNLAEVLQKYLKGFQDKEDYLLILDEIQNSHKVYNLLRKLARETNFKVIATGSYLGIASKEEFFYPAGDLFTLELNPLTFSEFLTGLPTYYNIYLEGIHEDKYIIKDKILQKIFLAYLYYGAYPEVLRELALQITNASLNEVILENKLITLKEMWLKESTRYLKNLNIKYILSDMFDLFCLASFNKKIGKNYANKFNTTTFRNAPYISKREQSEIFNWFLTSHIFTSMRKYNPSENNKILAISNTARIYYKCTGHIRQIAESCNSFKSSSELEGFLLEAYVANLLSTLVSFTRIKENLCFMADAKIPGELDFCTYRLKGVFDPDMGIEVKRGSNRPTTGKKYLKANYIKTLITTRANITTSEDLNTNNPIIPIIYLEDYLSKNSEQVQSEDVFKDFFK